MSSRLAAFEPTLYFSITTRTHTSCLPSICKHFKRILLVHERNLSDGDLSPTSRSVNRAQQPSPHSRRSSRGSVPRRYLRVYALVFVCASYPLRALSDATWGVVLCCLRSETMPRNRRLAGVALVLALDKGAEAFTAFPGSLGCSTGSNVVKAPRTRYPVRYHATNVRVVRCMFHCCRRLDRERVCPLSPLLVLFFISCPTLSVWRVS